MAVTTRAELEKFAWLTATHGWPLLFVPLTIILAKNVGHEAANLLLGAVFLYVFIYRSDIRLRRFMIVLGVFSGIFETANLASGSYSMSGTTVSPLWVSLGWSILGWWLMQLEPLAKRITFTTAFLATIGLIVAANLLSHTFSVGTPFALAGLYALGLAVRQPFALYTFVCGFSILAEMSGTYSGLWGYYDSNGLNILPDFALMALLYCAVIVSAIWISGFEVIPPGGTDKSKTDILRPIWLARGMARRPHHLALEALRRLQDALRPKSKPKVGQPSSPKSRRRA